MLQRYVQNQLDTSATNHAYLNTLGRDQVERSLPDSLDSDISFEYFA